MPPGQEEEGAAVPPAQRSSWSSFLKSIASFSGDLSSLTAPPFILSPISLTEFPAYWLERPNLFAAIADGADEQDRNLRVVQWFISTLKGQYTSRNDSMGSEKKPLNPVLGELFFGYWPDKDGRGTTKLTVEQVSHHPPITAYYITNKDKGLILQGHSAQKTSFSTGAIIVKQIGHAILTINLSNGNQEKYLITLPKLRIDGLWYGSPYIELTEMSYIVSSSGWSTAIEYKGRGYFSGKSHTFKAVMSPPPSPSGTLSATPSAPIVAEGQWTTTSKITSYSPGRSGRSSPVSPSLNGDNFTDVTSPKEEVTVAPVDEQGEWETRKLWFKVAKGIREGDYESASREKSRIENWQRQMRKDEQAAGTPWQLKYFVHVDNDPDYERLIQALQGTTVPPTEDAYLYNEPKA